MACGTSAALLRQVSRQSSTGELENLFSEELEFLQNVYFDEMTYEPGSCDQEYHTLQFHVTPSTGDDKERQYVYLVLNCTIPKEYPLVSPVLTVGQSRGLSDAHLRSIQEGLLLKAEGLLGCQMMYELVEFAKECLTDNNLPSGECAICLCGFQESEDFRKTSCYHYFHLSCLAWYMEYHQRQVKEDEQEDSKKDIMLRKKTMRQFECPVCRVPISNVDLTFDLAQDWSTLHVMDTVFKPSAELRAWQKNMEELLWKQRLKGGVIDPTQSDVIDPTWVSTASVKTKEEPTKEDTTQDNTQSEAHKDSAEKRPAKTKNGYYRYRNYKCPSAVDSREMEGDESKVDTEQRSRAPRQRRNRPKEPVEKDHHIKPQNAKSCEHPRDITHSPNSSRNTRNQDGKSRKGPRQRREFPPSNMDRPTAPQSHRRAREQKSDRSGETCSQSLRVKSGDRRRKLINDGYTNKTRSQEQEVSKPELKDEH